MQLIVTRIVDHTKDIKSFILEHPAGALLPRFLAGAHLQVGVIANDGVRSTRSYSISNAPQPGGNRHFELGVLRKGDGAGGSRYMHEAVRVGSLLEVEGPRNHFGLDPRARHHILLAGGIGITPIISMARELAERGASAELHYYGRGVAEVAFLPDLRALGGISLHEQFGGGPDEVRASLRHVLATPAADVHLYVCGPAGMIDSVIECAGEAGWNEANVHFERFVAAVAGPDLPFVAHLVRSARSVEVAAGVSLLDALVAAGVDIGADCRAGMCGACLTPVAGGRIDHRDSFLSDDDRRCGDLMCACVSRAAGPELRLDI